MARKKIVSKQELNPKVISLSLAGVSTILSLVCALLLAIAPKATLGFFGSIFHGIDMTKIATPVTFSGVITGLVAIIIVAFAVGWIFATIYNYLINKVKYGG